MKQKDVNKEYITKGDFVKGGMIIVLISLILVIIFAYSIIHDIKETNINPSSVFKGEWKEICLDGYKNVEVYTGDQKWFSDREIIETTGSVPNQRCYRKQDDIFACYEIRQECKSEPLNVWVQKK